MVHCSSLKLNLVLRCIDCDDGSLVIYSISRFFFLSCSNFCAIMCGYNLKSCEKSKIFIDPQCFCKKLCKESRPPFASDIKQPSIMANVLFFIDSTLVKS